MFYGNTGYIQVSMETVTDYLIFLQKAQRAPQRVVTQDLKNSFFQQHLADLQTRY